MDMLKLEAVLSLGFGTKQKKQIKKLLRFKKLTFWPTTLVFLHKRRWKSSQGLLKALDWHEKKKDDSDSDQYRSG